MTTTPAPTTTLESPEAMAERLRPCDRIDGDGAGALALREMVRAIRARDEQIAAWCEQKAAEAQREADAHFAQLTGAMAGGGYNAKRDRVERCEGQASAFPRHGRNAARWTMSAPLPTPAQVAEAAWHVGNHRYNPIICATAAVTADRRTIADALDAAIVRHRWEDVAAIVAALRGTVSATSRRCALHDALRARPVCAEAAALRRFRRAMRRHERRAWEQRVGFGAVEDIIRCHRLQPLPDSEDFLRGLAQSRRVRLSVDRSDPTNRRAAWLYERAADAVARLRADFAAVGGGT